jgi:transposase
MMCINQGFLGQMKGNSIDIDEVINKAKECLEKETQLSGSFKAVIQLIILLIGMLAGRLKLNSSNSSKPPSMDPNRKRKSENSGKKQGEQKGHKGNRLEKVANPDIIKILEVDKNALPPGKYQEKGFECRQVVNIERDCCKQSYDMASLQRIVCLLPRMSYP